MNKCMEYVRKNITFVFMVLGMLISFVIMILWGAIGFPTGMLSRRERVLFNHTSTALSLITGGIVFDHIMGNQTPYQLQLVYSCLGTFLYGVVLFIQFFNLQKFQASKLMIMIIIHIVALIIFVMTVISIITIERPMSIRLSSQASI